MDFTGDTEFWAEAEDWEQEQLELEADARELEAKLAQFGLLDEIDEDWDEDDDEVLCPMCGTEIDFDTGYCPECRELVI